MKNGMFVIDQVVHMFDNSQENLNSWATPTSMKSIADNFATPEIPSNEKWFSEYTTEDAHRSLFVDANVDMAVAQTVPLMGSWRNGFSPAVRNYEFAREYPERVIFCGGVDPMWSGIGGAVKELERQVVEWGAKSMKFYQAQENGSHWRADDRVIAYPLYEKALELGLTHVQFHKGTGFGKLNVEYLAPNDIQTAARDFPDLIFVLHHLGEPYSAETINIAQRFENVWLTLSNWINAFPFTPMACYHQLGRCLIYVGADRLMYGSEAFVWPRLEPYLDIVAGLTMPEELQDGYGYPALTDEIKRAFIGGNAARLMAIDVEAKSNELYGTQPGTQAP